MICMYKMHSLPLVFMSCWSKESGDEDEEDDEEESEAGGNPPSTFFGLALDGKLVRIH